MAGVNTNFYGIEGQLYTDNGVIQGSNYAVDFQRRDYDWGNQIDTSVFLYGVPETLGFNTFYIANELEYTQDGGIYKKTFIDERNEGNEQQNLSFDFFNINRIEDGAVISFNPASLTARVSEVKTASALINDYRYNDLFLANDHYWGWKRSQANMGWFNEQFNKVNFYPLAKVKRVEADGTLTDVDGGSFVNASRIDELIQDELGKTYMYIISDIQLNYLKYEDKYILKTQGSITRLAPLLYYYNNAERYPFQFFSYLEGIRAGSLNDIHGASEIYYNRAASEPEQEVLSWNIFTNFGFNNNYITPSYREDQDNFTIDTRMLIGRHCPFSINTSEVTNGMKYINPSAFTGLNRDTCFGWCYEVTVDSLNYKNCKIISNIMSLPMYLKFLTLVGVKLRPTENAEEKDWWTPIITDRWNITGEWAKGQEEAREKTPNNADLGSYEDKGTISEEDKPLPPEEDPNQENTVERIPVTHPHYSSASFFGQTYFLTPGQLNNFSSWLWTADETLYNEILEGLKLLGANPLDAVVSLKMFPFDLSNLQSTEVNHIKLGRVQYDSGTVLKGLGLSDITFAFNSCYIPRHFNNFLDYEPYTNVQLFLPYLGPVQLSTSDLIGKKITIQCIVDILTGDGMYIIWASEGDNATPYAYYTTKLAIDIPITSTQNSMRSTNLAMNLASGGLNATINALSGNLAGLVANVGAVGNTIAQQVATQQSTSFQTKGHLSSSLWASAPQDPYLIIERPVINKEINYLTAENYGHSVGFACDYYTQLENVRGFTICNNVDTSGIDCTDNERELIKSYLQGGVIL